MSKRKEVSKRNSWWNTPAMYIPTIIGDDLRKRMDLNSGRQNDPVFVKACEMAGIPVTKRQASKWNNGRGLALTFKYKAKLEVSNASN